MTSNPEPRLPGNSSGQGPLASVPPEIDRWNWGAFLLSWIWGIGNTPGSPCWPWCPS